MSEQEKKSSGSATGGSSVVMMEQSAASRHKQPYRPTDMQDESTDLHHKRSRAPAVPSVTEELKVNAESIESRDQKECDRAITADKQKQIAAKKLSSIAKRRDSSPETIKLAPVDVETKKEIIALTSQAIPANISHLPTVAIPKTVEREKVESEKKADDDSITEEIVELRTPEVATKESEWTKGGRPHKKKEISWYDSSYLQKVSLQDPNDTNRSISKSSMLDHKASVGPCLGPGTLIGGPSGISICIPKKSLRNLDNRKSSIKSPQSGICISVSRKYLDKPTKYGLDYARNGTDRVKIPKKEIKIDQAHFLNNIKGKIDNMFGKLRNAFHI